MLLVTGRESDVGFGLAERRSCGSPQDRSPTSGITASSIDSPPYQSAGSASIDATGTVQRRSVRAPQTTVAIAIGRRIRSGRGSDAQVPFLPAATFRVTTSTHDRHWSG